jgi:hypothetical protein
MAAQNLVYEDGETRVGAAPGDGSSGSASVIDVGSSDSQLGTTFKTVAVVYLEAGTILSTSSRFWLGVDNATDDAELEIRGAETGTLIATISKTGIVGGAQPSANIEITTAGYYSLRLRADAAAATAFFFGAHLVYVGGAPADFHGTTNSPVGSWDLNGALTADAGNALTVDAGTELYCPAAVLGEEAFWFDGATRLQQAHDANLLLQGELTVAFLIQMGRIETALRTIVQFGTAGETEATNVQYRVHVEAGNELAFYQENGAGVDDTAIFDRALKVGEIAHVCVTRDSAGTGVSLYVNGIARDTATMSNAPTGGGSGVLSIGGFPTVSNQYIGAMVSTPAIWDSELTAAQVLALARLTLPPELRS